MTNFLQRFVNVRREEVAPLLLAALFFFCILTAIGAMRPAREALGVEGGIDSVRWLFVGTAVVTLLANPVFGYLVSRYRRMAFIAATYLFSAASMLVFYALLVGAPEAIGQTSGRVFYVWYSVLNLFWTMVFWALMVDRFSLEQGKRLFAAIGAGGTAGAIFGPSIAFFLAEPLGTAGLLVVGAVFLVLAVVAAWAVTRVQPEREAVAGPADPNAPPVVDEKAVIGGSAWEGVASLFKSRYMSGITIYILILAIMSTFVYFTRLQMVAEYVADTDERTAVFAQIDAIAQSATLVLQLLVAGHLIKRFGVAVTLALLPITVVLGFAGLAILGTVSALIVFDAGFRAVQRGVMRPARETLFTVVSREDKYKAKAAIDTFFMRLGDVLQAGVVGLGAMFHLAFSGFAWVNVGLTLVWLFVVTRLSREHRQMHF
jgi:AAA family ATP:ADP antiporter